MTGLTILEIMERKRCWEEISSTELEVVDLWWQMGHHYELPIHYFGLLVLIKLRYDSPNNIAYKKLITQEMLSKDYLARNSIYVCTEHTLDVIAGYTEVLDGVFALICECEEGRDVSSLL